MGSSKKKFARKLSEINVVDEQELREASANIEPKHHNDVADLINSYKSLYPKWVFDLSKHYTRDCVDFVGWKVYGEESCFLEATYFWAPFGHRWALHILLLSLFRH
ncbi:hypothetical protein V6Z11_D06G191500 [Gossypium hirsutum]